MPYTYTKIADLDPGARPQNFYGKVIFHGKYGDTHVLLLKDETGLFYVWVTPKPNQELKLQLKQIIRVHRCVISGSRNDFIGKATIGKAGCHLIAWSPFGKPENPKVISSKEWSRSKEDEERIRTLSELDRGGDKLTVNEVAEKLIEIREAQRAEKNVVSWMRKVIRTDAERTRSNVSELLYRKEGTVVEMKGDLPVDRLLFDEENVEEFIQFFLRCETCFEENRTVYYVRDEVDGFKCPNCRKKLENLEVAIRIKIDCPGHQLVFTIPTTLIDGHENFPDLCTRFGKKYEMIEFCKLVKRKLWNVSLTKVHGIVMGRSEMLKFADVFVFESEFLDLESD